MYDFCLTKTQTTWYYNLLVFNFCWRVEHKAACSVFCLLVSDLLHPSTVWALWRLDTAPCAAMGVDRRSAKCADACCCNPPAATATRQLIQCHLRDHLQRKGRKVVLLRHDFLREQDPGVLEGLISHVDTARMCSMSYQHISVVGWRFMHVRLLSFWWWLILMTPQA